MGVMISIYLNRGDLGNTHFDHFESAVLLLDDVIERDLL